MLLPDVNGSAFQRCSALLLHVGAALKRRRCEWCRQSSLEAMSRTLSFTEVASLYVAGRVPSPGSPHSAASLPRQSGGAADSLKNVEVLHSPVVLMHLPWFHCILPQHVSVSHYAIGSPLRLLGASAMGRKSDSVNAM